MTKDDAIPEGIRQRKNAAVTPAFIAEIKKHVLRNPGCSKRNMAKILHVSLGTIQKVVRENNIQMEWDAMGIRPINYNTQYIWVRASQKPSKEVSKKK
uniref:HTH_7 domain-containing protein n=1 Tax=Rhabditophanes sp. KR3021 TaxID=114890 RepID=A0AC35TL75_9BILA